VKNLSSYFTVCVLLALLFLGMAAMFLGGRAYKLALGAFIVALVCAGLAADEYGRLRRDAALRKPPFTTDRCAGYPQQRKHPIR
jgi:hypothetical protein